MCEWVSCICVLAVSWEIFSMIITKNKICWIVLFVCFYILNAFHRTLMASTHVNHNIYITEVKTGKCLHSLVGHRRTPWCVTFHPTIPGLVASGCLDGEVRIWDLHVSVCLLLLLAISEVVFNDTVHLWLSLSQQTQKWIRGNWDARGCISLLCSKSELTLRW